MAKITEEVKEVVGKSKGFGGSYCYQRRRAKCSADCIW